MRRTTMTVLRIAGACTLAVFLVESLVVDGNGCLFDLGSTWSSIIAWTTVSTGIVVSSVLSWRDTGWRRVHFGCLAVYVAMLIPLFVG
jgi:hypothetical protein